MTKFQFVYMILIAISVAYICFHVLTKGYQISYFTYAVLCASVYNLSIALMNFLMFRNTDKNTIGLAYWVSLFSYSQLMSNFIPGLGVLYRATTLKKTKGVAIRDSTTAFLRGVIVTCLFMIR